MDKCAGVAMPDVIAKIATSDDFQKIAKHVLKLRKCAALGPMIGT